MFIVLLYDELKLVWGLTNSVEDLKALIDYVFL